MIIAVEGIDCAGKGEVCSRLAVALNALLYKTPPEHMREEQNRVNATATDIEHYRYFVEVVKAASLELEILSKTQNVVVDRYWMTTVVYHRVMGIPSELSHMGDILMPDFTVYLEVSAEVQAVRMSNRGMSPGDERMDGRGHLIRQTYNDVISKEKNVIRIDTSHITPEDVINLIMAKAPLTLNG